MKENSFIASKSEKDKKDMSKEEAIRDLSLKIIEVWKGNDEEHSKLQDFINKYRKDPEFRKEYERKQKERDEYFKKKYSKS